MDYIKTSHSKHCIAAHLIFVCKYRKELLNKCGKDIKCIFNAVSEEQNINILGMEIDQDHIHLLVQYNPRQSILEIVRSFKQISTYRIWRSEYRTFLRKHFWRERSFWSDRYFASSLLFIYTVFFLYKENVRYDIHSNVYIALKLPIYILPQ